MSANAVHVHVQHVSCVCACMLVACWSGAPSHIKIEPRIIYFAVSRARSTRRLEMHACTYQAASVRCKAWREHHVETRRAPFAARLANALHACSCTPACARCTAIAFRMGCTAPARTSSTLLSAASMCRKHKRQHTLCCCCREAELGARERVRSCVSA